MNTLEHLGGGVGQFKNTCRSWSDGKTSLPYLLSSNRVFQRVDAPTETVLIEYCNTEIESDLDYILVLYLGIKNKGRI